MPENQGTKPPTRAKICIGDSEVLSAWAAICPQCYGKFQLLWPFWVLQIPLHRVVDLRCPFCQKSFSLVAASLTPCDEGEHLALSLVVGLS
jgi:hypothetical protein